MEEYTLNERDKAILRYVVHQFILTANPVGSRNISKKYALGLSPATIRNIMADLEEMGLLGHPHTSAGRVPTDKGYRFYVDSLMEPPNLDTEAKSILDTNFNIQSSETEELLKITAMLLGDITNQIALVSYPKFENAALEKIQIVQLSSTRILVIITILTGLVKTITLELNVEIKEDNISFVQQFLNEKLAGLTFSEIRETIKERVKDYQSDAYRPIIRVFLDSVDKIFTDINAGEKSFISGTRNLIKQPEFEDSNQVKGIIELVEDKDVIVHIMDHRSAPASNNVTVTIGGENKEEKLNDFSVITKNYDLGGAKGTVGIMGPKRMEYSKIIAAVVYAAELLTNELRKK
jgi:heat-inducible transcriptional repressor